MTVSVSESMGQALSFSLFAVPKAFSDHTGIIQTNALESWKQLGLAREIILLGNDEGVGEAASNIGAIHCHNIKLDEMGTPFLDDVFRVAKNKATSEWLCYVNADIILMPEFCDVVANSAAAIGKCLMISRRWNLDVNARIDFTDGWQHRLREMATKEAQLFSPYGIDVFVFHRSFFEDVPPFSLGRSFWDNWIVTEARRRGYPVIDLTENYNVIHQNHTYDGFESMEDIRRSQQGLRNFWLAGDSNFRLSSVNDATHRIKEGKVVSSTIKTVSVVMPHAGSLAQLKKCLSALSHQSYPRSYIEVIVVENSDRSASTPARLDYPFIKLTREMKSGPAAARNKGAAIAQGQIIAFLDSDCYPDGDWVEKAVQAAEVKNLECVIACNIKPSRSGSGKPAVEWYEALEYHNQKGYVEACQACITGAMIVPRRVWLSVGPFNEAFSEAACEDWEWSTRASSYGVPIIYAAEAIVTHPVHTSWYELREKANRLARGELRLARMRATGDLISLPSVFVQYTKRFKDSVKKTMRTHKLPLRLKVEASFAAARVCYWSIKETRKQLNTPDL